MLQEQTPDTEDADKRREIIQAVDDIVQDGLPDYPGLCIRPYGSYVSGLYSPSGDLDLSIEGTPSGGCACPSFPRLTGLFSVLHDCADAHNDTSFLPVGVPCTAAGTV